MGKISDSELLAMADKAFAEHQLLPYYQPQYNISTGMLIGAEALARWIHPELGIISPADFIPLFEKNHLISKPDLSMMESVCIFLRKCLDNNIHTVPVSINLSREDVYAEGFIDRMEEIKNQYQIPSKLIRVEVVESIAAGNAGKAQEIIKKINNLGYLVELDDFGSGYSSLNVLKDIAKSDVFDYCKYQ